MVQAAGGPSGFLVSFEGIEGCGKSTQIQRLADCLEERGLKVVTTREPGATRLGAELRHLLLDPEYDHDALTELFLYLADRRDHFRRVIAPALERGSVVLVDRFVDSTRVYQGDAGGDPRLTGERIDELNRLAVANRLPDLTLLFDCPVEVGLARARQRNLESGAVGRADRFEQRELEFHQRVRDGFLALARGPEGKRFRILDAAAEMEDIAVAVQREFEAVYAFC